MLIKKQHSSVECGTANRTEESMNEEGPVVLCFVVDIQSILAINDIPS